MIEISSCMIYYDGYKNMSTKIIRIYTNDWSNK